MASGINSTFRQVGIATGIAGLGSIFTHVVSTHIVALLHGARGVGAHQAGALAGAVSQGTAAREIGSLPAAARPTAEHALRTAFTTGLNEVFIVGALLCLAAAVLTFFLIRTKDFDAGHGAPAGPGPQAGATASPLESDRDEPEHATQQPAAPRIGE